MNEKSLLKTWVLAARPWSLTASFTPLALGSLLAYAQGFSFLWGRFFVLLFCGIGLQVATNFFNTYADFRAGVDTEEHADDTTLVKKALTPEVLLRAAWVMLCVSAAAGVVLAWMCGWAWQLFVFGILGVVGAYAYTMKPWPLKYNSCGPIAVFFLMGALMVMPAYFAQAGVVSVFSFWAAMPISCLVAAIMHANDVRDIDHDRKAGICTLAVNLGRYKAVKTLEGFYFGAFISAVVLGFWQPGFFLPLVLLPIGLRNLRPLHGDMAHLHLPDLDGKTAKLHFQFGLLTMAGLLLTAWLRG